MAVRTDVTVDFTLSPRVIEVASPSTTINIQDLYDTLRTIEARTQNMDDLALVDNIRSGGKQTLSATKEVGITLTLNNAVLQFQARAGPAQTQCTITDGNLVAIDDMQVAIRPTQATAFVSIDLESDVSAAIVSGTSLPRKNVAVPQFHFTMRDNVTHLPVTGLTVSGQIAQDAGAFAAISNSIAEVGNGVYRVIGGFTQSEMNADTLTVRFSATGADDSLITIVTARE